MESESAKARDQKKKKSIFVVRKLFPLRREFAPTHNHTRMYGTASLLVARPTFFAVSSNISQNCVEILAAK